MQCTRRKFLHQSGAAGLLAACGARWPQSRTPAVGTELKARTLDATKLASFVDPLPLPVLQSPQGRRSSPTLGASDAPFYPIRVREIHCKMHRDLPPTRLWSYGSTSAPPLFETSRGEGVLIDWINQLPHQHFLPIGPPKAGMEQDPPTRLSTHLHGARVPSVSDGYPENWYGPGSHRLCYYPNQQDSAALWYHDHAMGVSLFNIFAGLMGWYIIRDEVEENLELPSGQYELPLLLYDRSFDLQGQLYYPNPPDQGAWSQEYLGDAIVVNGKIRPYHQVEPRRYRLRIANTANSRFFSLSFSNGQAFHVIGSDQGLLASPVEVTRLVLAPAERADFVADFSASRGENVNLVSDELEIMQFRVEKTAVAEDRPLPKILRALNRMSEQDATGSRFLTLDQYDAENGSAMVMLLNRRHWNDPVTERVRLHSVEIWSLANLTQDTHPIHLHMVRFQVLDRRSFSVDDYLAANGLPLRWTGAAMPPADHEMGWKDVVQCPPGMVTRIVVPFTPFAGRYVWHCHILEHEANEMMRPYDVIL
jgi:spore coat protein A